MAANQDRLLPGESLGPDQAIYSHNKRCMLVYQPDGNLVLYGNDTNPREVLWSSRTNGQTVSKCVM